MRGLAGGFAAALVLTSTAGIGADMAEGSYSCVDETIGRDFLNITYTDVVLVREGDDTRLYRGSKAGQNYTIEMDACTTQLLSEEIAPR